jgi:hypothetical protein
MLTKAPLSLAKDPYADDATHYRHGSQIGVFYPLDAAAVGQSGNVWRVARPGGKTYDY